MTKPHANAQLVANWTTAPIGVALPELIAERSLSLRRIAALAEVDPSHLSRGLRGKGDKQISGELAGRIAEALGLPVDYFPEYREMVIVRAVREDPALRDRLYKRLAAQRD